MDEFFASFRMVFDAVHSVKTIITGALIVVTGIAIYGLAKRMRYANPALDVFGPTVTGYGAGHVSACLRP
ncbi:hypothetical protein RvVAT039_05880 [Agrobacterium vitis]|uniref:hypothetical protein n=1 Tax=Agrobacterium vitis TaxID=373 RepID=UPI0015D9C45E|nr:hypothetical protein [Agrobacterium vitis]BCH63372.1 hypothetical protein RvVAT039_05880 [Agrobacterium vitis]